MFSIPTSLIMLNHLKTVKPLFENPCVSINKPASDTVYFQTEGQYRCKEKI